MLNLKEKKILADKILNDYMVSKNNCYPYYFNVLSCLSVRNKSRIIKIATIMQDHKYSASNALNNDYDSLSRSLKYFVLITQICHREKVLSETV